MNALDFDWDNARQLQSAVLKSQLFELLQSVAREIQFRETDDPELLSIVPRLLDLFESRDDIESFRPIVSSAARSLGLWNYVEKQNGDSRDALLAEAVSIPRLGDIILHREQLSALNALLDGTNLILSAPTSFGKSVLIDALLAVGNYKRVAIVLPTIALLDEFRRRLLLRFGDEFDVLMHHTEKGTGENVIFLGTQERLINRGDLGDLDLLVVDEFYKLDPARKDERSLTLNAAVYQLLRTAKQFFFLGPNIDAVKVSEGVRWQFEFLKTRFLTVAVDTLDLTEEEDKAERLVKEVFNEELWPALVFVSSPGRANELSNRLVERNHPIGDAEELATWIEGNFGGASFLSASVMAGVGLHHGRIPRALASRFIKLFNEGKLPVLICTSTLIEGVNTAAKSVLIYDKKINKENYDFFTFSNIRGRAGRLGQHHVGKVYLFNLPPPAEDIDVQAPLFSELGDAPDELIVHLTEDERTPEISERADEVAADLDLTLDELRRLAPLGLDNLRTLKAVVESALSEGRKLVWRHMPRYADVENTVTVICKTKPANTFGARSPRQLALYIHKLRTLRTLEAFYEWHSSTYSGDATDWDNVFKFLRACDYSLPEYFGAVETFVRKRYAHVDYKFFIGGLVRWFRPGAVKELEDQGVPAQISERFARVDDDASTLGARLRVLALGRSEAMSPFERSWVLDALPQRRQAKA